MWMGELGAVAIIAVLVYCIRIINKPWPKANEVKRFGGDSK
jgi:hypothetical protein